MATLACERPGIASRWQALPCQASCVWTAAPLCKKANNSTALQKMCYISSTVIHLLCSSTTMIVGLLSKLCCCGAAQHERSALSSVLATASLTTNQTCTMGSCVGRSPGDWRHILIITKRRLGRKRRLAQDDLAAALRGKSIASACADPAETVADVGAVATAGSVSRSQLHAGRCFTCTQLFPVNCRLTASIALVKPVQQLLKRRVTQ